MGYRDERDIPLGYSLGKIILVIQESRVFSRTVMPFISTHKVSVSPGTGYICITLIPAQVI